jgi:hypothetical protein
MNARSSRCWPKIRLAILASSALLLTGCATRFGTFTRGDAPLQVKLPAFCETILRKVPPPTVTRKTDARVAFTRTADALDEANGRIGIGGACLRDQRQAYAPSKEKPR